MVFKLKYILFPLDGHARVFTTPCWCTKRAKSEPIWAISLTPKNVSGNQENEMLAHHCWGVCTCSDSIVSIERVQLLQWAHQVVLLYQHSLLFAAFPFVLFGEKSKATSGPDWALSKRDNLVKEMHLMKRSASASEPMTPAEHLHPLLLLCVCVCIRALCQLGHEKVLCMRVLLEKERHARHCLPDGLGYRARQSTTHGTRRRSERASIKTKQLCRRQHAHVLIFDFVLSRPSIPVPAAASVSPQHGAFFIFAVWEANKRNEEMVKMAKDIEVKIWFIIDPLLQK